MSIQNKIPSTVAEELDPITIEVIRGNLETVADEMSLTMKRTAVTPIFSESSDYSCAVMDGDARLMAQALRTASLPVHMGAMKFSAQAVLDTFAGDINHGAGYSGDNSNSQESAVDQVTVRQTERDLAGSKGYIHAQFCLDLADCIYSYQASFIIGTHGQC